MKPTKLAAKEANDYVDTDQPLDKHIQEKLLALLCYDEEYGAKVATIVSADVFRPESRIDSL